MIGWGSIARSIISDFWSPSEFTHASMVGRDCHHVRSQTEMRNLIGLTAGSESHALPETTQTLVNVLHD